MIRHVVLAAVLYLNGAMYSVDAMQLAQAAELPLAELETEIRNNPQSAQTWDALGLAYARERRFVEAFESLNQANKLSPESKHILYHLALVYAWSGNYAEAIRRYTDLIDQYPEDTGIRIDYGQTLAWDRQFDAARRQYEEVLRQDADHIEALRHMGILTAWEGGYKQALEILESALALDANNIRVLSAKAEILSWMGDLAEAAKAYQQALDIAPKDAAMRTKLAQIYQWQGRVRTAQQEYLSAIASGPEQLEAYLGLSNSYRENHQYNEAEDLLRRAILLFPDEPRISESLTEIAAERSWRLSDIAHRAEPAVFIALLLFVLYYAHRYRRVLPKNRWVLRVLFVVIPMLAVTTVAMYSFVLWGGAYYREAQTIGQFLEMLNLLVLITVFTTLVWLLRFGRNVSHQVVMAIGAHPDDIEFGCGATLLRYREAGCQTHGLILTAGREGFDAAKKSETRISEARASAKTLALADLQILDFPDAQLSSHKQRIKDAIEAEVKRIKPDIVFTHTPNDVHSDHKTVFEATREAVRGACTILCYENPNTPPSFQPTFYVDVTDFIDDKIAALSWHKTQADKAYTAPEVVRSSASFRGAQARIKYAEAYEVVRVLEKS